MFTVVGPLARFSWLLYIASLPQCSSPYSDSVLFLNQLYTLVLHGCLGYTHLSQHLSDSVQSISANSPRTTLTGSMVISILICSGKFVILVHTFDILISVLCLPSVSKFLTFILFIFSLKCLFHVVLLCNNARKHVHLSVSGEKKGT